MVELVYQLDKKSTVFEKMIKPLKCHSDHIYIL